MKDQKSPFFAFRYLVTSASRQIAMELLTHNSKEEIIRHEISELSTKTKTEWLCRNQKFLFYGFGAHDDIHIVKFAKVSTEHYFVEGDNDVDEKGIEAAKFVYLIFDVTHQIVLVERNQSVFQHVESCVNILNAYFKEKIKKYDYTISTYPLCSKSRFWEYIRSSECIYELSLEMNAPNMPLFGNADTRDALALLKEETNNEVVQVSFKNTDGKLNVAESFFSGYISYILEVGGKYMMKIMRHGQRETKTSQSDNIRSNINRNSLSKPTDVEIEQISKRMKEIHLLETRTDDAGQDGE